MAAENGDDGKKAAVFRGQRHGDLSVLLRCLIESAAQAVLFVSSQRKGGEAVKKAKRERKHISNTQEEGHVTRVQHHGQRQTAASNYNRDTSVCFNHRLYIEV